MEAVGIGAAGMTERRHVGAQNEVERLYLLRVRLASIEHFQRLQHFGTVDGDLPYRYATAIESGADSSPSDRRTIASHACAIQLRSSPSGSLGPMRAAAATRLRRLAGRNGCATTLMRCRRGVPVVVPGRRRHHRSAADRVLSHSDEQTATWFILPDQRRGQSRIGGQQRSGWRIG
jgi:hypothetical protein